MKKILTTILVLALVAVSTTLSVKVFQLEDAYAYEMPRETGSTTISPCYQNLARCTGVGITFKCTSNNLGDPCKRYVGLEGCSL